jgi:hypothetical protein
MASEQYRIKDLIIDSGNRRVMDRETVRDRDRQREREREREKRKTLYG